MIGRWPIRIRLAAAFTIMMALVLTAVGWATLAHTRSSLDSSITESLTYRLADLRPVAATAEPLLPAGDVDTAEQVVGPAGRIVATTPGLGDTNALTASELDTARRGQLVVDHDTAGELTGPVRIAAAPVDGGRVLVAAVSLADRDTAVADLRRQLLTGFPTVLAAAAIGAYLLAAAALRPVERMRARAATITDTDPEARLPVPAADDEIARLGTTFNELLSRLHTALQRERRFVSDAGHELRTPLSLLTTELELALRHPRPAIELTAALRSALDETGRLTRLAQDLLLAADPARPADTPPPTTELRPALDTVAARYRHTLPGSDLTVDCPPGLHASVRPDDLDRIIANLIDNATEHGRPPIAITVTNGTDSMITVNVRDHGPGFDPIFLPHALDRFTRADTARTHGGTGLGLAIVDVLTRRNHATVTTHNHPDGGADITIQLSAA